LELDENGVTADCSLPKGSFIADCLSIDGMEIWPDYEEPFVDVQTL
jgi:hypothetical protein